MEIVNCIGFKQSVSPLDSFMDSIYGLQKKFNVQKTKTSFDLLSLFRSLGSFVNFVEANAKVIFISLLSIAGLLLSFSGIFKAVDYFSNTTGQIKLDSNYESEMNILNKIMNDFALETSSEYSADGTLLDSEISAKDMQKLFSQPVTFQTYKVQAGDSISSITKKFGLNNISTLIAVNDIDNVRQLRAGQKLKIPSIDGLYYVVQKGNSLQGLSSKFGVTIEDILDVNELESSELAVGQLLFIPGAKLDKAKLSQAMGELFKNPISVKYRLSSRFGPRSDPFTGARSNHTGIDMACPTGTPIVATASGTITYSGTSPVFGYYVIINHGNGYQSLYGHMSKILVKKGQWVSQGTRIGLVGSTGYSTGPHLHFTVFKNGKLVDPLTLIKK